MGCYNKIAAICEAKEIADRERETRDEIISHSSIPSQ